MLRDKQFFQIYIVLWHFETFALKLCDPYMVTSVSFRVKEKRNMTVSLKTFFPKNKFEIILDKSTFLNIALGSLFH